MKEFYLRFTSDISPTTGQMFAANLMGLHKLFDISANDLLLITLPFVFQLT